MMANEEVTTSYARTAGEPRFVSLSVRYDAAKLQALQRAVRGIPNALARMVPSALNKTAGEMRNWLARQLGLRLWIQRKESLDSRVTVHPKASGANWTSGVRIDLRRFTLAAFPHHQQREGVWWISGPSGKGKVIPRSFIQKSYRHWKTGAQMDVEQVYRRAGRGDGTLVPRYPIMVLRGPSLGIVFSRDQALLREAQRHGAEVLDKKLASQVQRVIAAQVPK